VRSLDPRLGLANLTNAAETLRADQDDLFAEAMLWQGVALHRLEDDEADIRLREALAECRRLASPKPELELRVRAYLAAVLVSRAEWARVISTATDAMNRSDGATDYRLMVRVHGDLSAAYSGLGDAASALQHAHKALAIAQAQNDPIWLARLENNLGLLLVREGSFDRAHQYLQRSLDHCAEAGLVEGKSHVLLSLAEAQAGVGRLDAALESISEARRLCETTGEKLTLAAAYELQGDVLQRRGDDPGADAAYAQALTLLKGAPGRAVEVMVRQALALERRGDDSAALGLLKEAMHTLRPALSAWSWAPALGTAAGRSG
jgi:tetratricopeptide (TPR) repeat protein